MNETKFSDVIVCLGQALLPGAKASPVLLSRCDQAVVLQRERACFIINTGGDPANVGITEARIMTDYMVNVKSIKKDLIIQEEQSRSTLENALFVLRILQDIVKVNMDKLDKLYLVTSPHHMVRSSYVFKMVFEYYKFKIDVIEEPSNDLLTQNEFEQLLMNEKRGIEYHLNKRIEFASPVMGHRSGHSVPLPDRMVLTSALVKIDTMLSALEKG